jgi:hypothetical protein
MRLSDTGMRRRKTKAVYPDHRPSPRLIEFAPRERSNRFLDAMLTTKLQNPPLQNYCDNGRHTEYQQKDWELLVQGVPSLRNADPQVGA